MYEFGTGVVLIIIALAAFIPSVFNLNRRHDQANSPLIWIGLIAGIFLGGFGILLVLLHWRIVVS
jgi:H+/Cl- antiporter ClcA